MIIFASFAALKHQGLSRSENKIKTVRLKIRQVALAVKPLAVSRFPVLAPDTDSVVAK